MADNFLEEGRPPDSPHTHPKARNNSWSHPDNSGLDVNRNGLQDGCVKRRNLKQTIPKLLCIKRPMTVGDDYVRFVESASKIAACDNLKEIPSGSGNKNRNSFHQDVDEALNSLLWQPYEYQNKPSSSCSSSCSSLASFDLDDPPNKGPLDPSQDLNLRTEMVNNLKPSHQCRGTNRSRDQLSCYATSRLNSQASLLECVDGSAACSGNCDVFVCKNAMQLEVPSNSTSVGHTNVLNIATDNGLNNNVTLFQSNLLQQQPQPKSSSNLSSANVVGLPRRASVPSPIRNPTGNGNVFPNHPRNGSEPATTMSNQFRYNNQPNVVVPVTHQRNSQIDQNFVTHLRSSSVPKSSSSSTTTPPQHQRINSDSNQKPPINVSNVNVNFYRAVPVNVVSSVPTIQCLNTLNNDEGNNVSNVHIMPLGNSLQLPQNIAVSTGTTQVTVHNTQTPTHNSINVNIPRPTRTFTSTEAQTDEITVCPPPPAPLPETTTNPNREQRRRERRERRHQRRLNVVNHRHTVDSSTQASPNDRLPDLLNSHLPPPYSPLANNNPPPNVVVPGSVMVPPPHGALLQTVVSNNVNGLVAFPGPQVVSQVPMVQGSGPVAVPVPPPSGFRFPFAAAGFRRGRFSEEPPKGCCGLLTWKPGSLRWFIAVIALVAVCCVLVGTALGAMRPAGRDHLTVSLLMIGVGIVLVTVSGVAWRLTSHDSSTCRSMLGLGSTESVDVCTRRFVPRLPPSYGRPHHPYAAMMYPEFQYRPPPPSYQASMQEYRLRLLLLDRGNTPQIQAGIQNAVSPPPTYRSHAGSLLRAPLSNRRDATQSEYSCPPSYRSQASMNRPGTLHNSSVLHSREQSLSLSESNNGGSVVNVVNILGSTEEDLALDNITLDSLKMEPESDINALRMLLKGSSSDLEGSKDGNLVTIVQTSDQSPVIVTVSGSSHLEENSVQITEIPSEMEILAHL